MNPITPAVDLSPDATVTLDFDCLMGVELGDQLKSLWVCLKTRAFFANFGVDMASRDASMYLGGHPDLITAMVSLAQELMGFEPSEDFGLSFYGDATPVGRLACGWSVYVDPDLPRHRLVVGDPSEALLIDLTNLPEVL